MTRRNHYGDHEHLGKIDERALREEEEVGRRNGWIGENEWFCLRCGRLYHKNLGDFGHKCNHHPECPEKYL